MKRSSNRKPLSELLTRAVLRDLANMRDEGPGRFRKRWHELYGRYTDDDLLRWRDELQLLWSVPFATIRHPDVSRLEKQLAETIPLQETPRNAAILEMAHHSPGDPLEKVICESWLREAGAKSPWVVEWGKQKRIRANPRCLPAILALACVGHADRFGICRNPQCRSPYFFTDRSDQRYCSINCAWLAKKAAKRKWWRTHRAKN